jgi:DNA (cytosine-5)-methyltransferase 1
MGYHRAGFEVVGVDIAPQPNYPFPFVQGDALTYLGSRPATRVADWFDVVHASPPCQKFSSLTHLGKGAGVNAPDLIAPVRDALETVGRPYVIENVVGAPLRSPYVLCGSSFELGVCRHRLFETSFPLMVPRCACHASRSTIGVYGDHPQRSKGMNRAETLPDAQHAMGIDWMTWPEIREAIPPAYTEFIGSQLIEQLARVA